MIKVAIVGLGRIGICHVRECQMVNGFKVVALCDTNPELLEKATAETKLPGFSSYSKMLRDVDADLITLAIPSHLHCRMALEALKKGFNVFLEKPMAGTLEECRRMEMAAHRAQRFLTVNQNKRFGPDVQHIRKIIRSGRIGEIHSMYTSIYGFAERTDWQIWKKYNGGMLANWGVHLVDSMLYLLDEEPQTVFAKLHRILDKGDVEDSFKIVIHFKNGMIGEAEALKSIYPKPQWYIAGSKGTIICEHTGAIVQIKTMIAGKSGNRESIHEINWTDYPYGLLPHYEALKKSLSQTGNPVVSTPSVCKTMAVLDAARKSSSSGGSVKIV